jgi:LPXTG-site transpeptidase (sortase) family protein
MPTVTAFTATSPSSTWNIPIPTFTATDDLAVTGYLITTSATPPAAGAAGWTATVPTSYTVAANGTYTLYPWVKDADGHVSGLYGSPASVVVDTTPLVVHFGEFSIPPSEGANLIIGPSQLVVRFSENVVSDGSPNAANSLWNYMLLRPGPNGVFDTLISTAPPGIDPICDSDHVSEGDDEKIDFSNATYNAATFAATLTIDPTFAPLANGTYRLYVCGAASINDLAGNPLNGGANTAINFTVSPAPVAPTAAPAATPLRAGRRVPNTGFAPGRVTLLAPQTASYADLGDLWLEVPKLGVKMSIVGVPKKDNEWDVSWLGRNAGWLEGSAFPSWNGNSVLTGHVWNADNSAGPFRYLNTLWWGDKVIVHLSGHKYIYEVRAVKQVASTNVSAMMKHEELPWLTLVTCKGYDEEKDEYRDRILVRAVLIEVK